MAKELALHPVLEIRSAHDYGCLIELPWQKLRKSEFSLSPNSEDMTPMFLYQAPSYARVSFLSAKEGGEYLEPNTLHIILLKTAVILCFMTTAISAATFGNFTYTDNETYITITGYPTAAVGAVEIPASINGKPVTIIGDGAFRECVDLTSIAIPNSVTTIERTAFYDCSSLSSITMPDSVLSVGEAAFRNCGSLVSAIIGNGVTIIGYHAFLNCGSLTSVTIGNSVTEIRSLAFQQCSSLTSVTIPASVWHFGDGVFRECSGLVSVVFLSQSIGVSNYMFQGCSNLTSITSNVITYIGISGFESCSSLMGISLSISASSIGQSAFSNCTSLASISIPDSVTSIGQSAFSDCASLASISIPDSVTSIGPSAFSNCTNLMSISTGNGVTSIGQSTFYCCSSLMNATIGNSIQTIDGSAFQGCSSLVSVTFPDSLNWISDFAFSNCNSLTKILFTGNAPGVGASVFLYAYQSTVFYLPGTSGWKSNLGTRPTALWAPPVITNQPASVIVNPGENATFSVTASANAALPAGYQWQKNGIAIPGAVNSSLALTGIQAANIGNYTVVITNDAGSVVSAVASLTIATGNLYTQAQYEAALQLGFNLGMQAGSSAVIEDPNSYELYTLTQVQEIHVGKPLLEKDSATGKFKMTIRAQKSTDLTNFSPFPFTAGAATINLNGDLEFQFTSPDAAAFFRLGVE